MKTYLVAAAVALAMTGTAAAQSETIRIGTEGAYAPWNFVDDNGDLAGFDVDVMNELCDRAELECTLVQTAWDTIIPNLNAGNFDVIAAGMSITEERRQSIDFTADYSPPESSAFMMQADTTVDFDNLSGVRIGTQTGTIQAGYATEKFADGNTLLSFDTADQALADLSAGNIDVIFADHSYVMELVAGSGGALKTEGPNIPIGEGVGAGVRKTDTELREKLDSALAEAKADGTIDELIKKWFPEREGPFYVN